MVVIVLSEAAMIVLMTKKVLIANAIATLRRASRSHPFLAKFYCVCAQTAISQLLIKIPTSLLDSLTPIS